MSIRSKLNIGYFKKKASKTRSHTAFDNLVNNSDLNYELGHNMSSPISTLRILLTQYNNKTITRKILNNEITRLIKANPDILYQFRLEVRKHNLNIILKDNYVDQSEMFTLRSFKKNKPTNKSVKRSANKRNITRRNTV